MLGEEQRNQMKQKRLDHYDRVVFDMEMDLVAAEAAGEMEAAADVKTQIDKLRQARAAVEKL